MSAAPKDSVIARARLETTRLEREQERKARQVPPHFVERLRRHFGDYRSGIHTTDYKSQPEPVIPDSARTTNPVEGWDVNVQVPEIELRMVNADALEEYEIWFGLGSIFAAATVGFIVAHIQSSDAAEQLNTVQPNLPHRPDHTFLLVAVIFLVMLIAAGIRAYLLRRGIKSKSIAHKMKVTSS